MNLLSFITVIGTISSSSCIYLNPTTLCLCSEKKVFNPEKFLVDEMTTNFVSLLQKLTVLLIK